MIFQPKKVVIFVCYSCFIKHLSYGTVQTKGETKPATAR